MLSLRTALKGGERRMGLSRARIGKGMMVRRQEVEKAIGER